MSRLLRKDVLMLMFLFVGGVALSSGSRNGQLRDRITAIMS